VERREAFSVRKKGTRLLSLKQIGAPDQVLYNWHFESDLA